MGETIDNVLNRCKIMGMTAKKIYDDSCIVGEPKSMFGVRIINGKAHKTKEYSVVRSGKSLIVGERPLFICTEYRDSRVYFRFINNDMEESASYDTLMQLGNGLIIAGQRIDYVNKNNEIYGLIDYNENMIISFKRGLPLMYNYTSRTKNGVYKINMEKTSEISKMILENNEDVRNKYKDVIPLSAKQVMQIRHEINYDPRDCYRIFPFGTEIVPPTFNRYEYIKASYIVIVDEVKNKLYGPYEFGKDGIKKIDYKTVDVH